MANSSKRKGDKAELEVQGLLRDLLGVSARRALGAGRKDDIGDITGVDDTVIQVVNWKDVAKAVREKPLECERQREHAWEVETPGVRYLSGGPTHAATFVRLRGGEYRVVLTVEQWATLYREAME